MYAAVRKYKIKSGSIDEVTHKIPGFVSIVSQAPGFIAYHFVNTGNDSVMTISIFHDQAGADESTKMAATWVQENLASLVQGPPEVTTGEVTAHKFK